MSPKYALGRRTVAAGAALLAVITLPAGAATKKNTTKKVTTKAASVTTAAPTTKAAAASTTAPSTTGRSGGNAVFGLDAECGGWLPNVNAWGGSCGLVAGSVYERWMSLGYDGTPVPNLVESAKPSADYRTWTLAIRSGIKFHNGEALDGAAFVANLDAMRTGPSSASFFTNLAGCTASGQTATCTMKQPWVTFTSVLTIGAANAVAPAQLKANDTRHLVGTGAFMCKGDCWVPGQKITLVKNPDYWRKGLPKLDSIEFRPIPDEDQRLAQFTSGQLQFMMSQDLTTGRDLGNRAKDGKLKLFADDHGGPVIYDMPNLARTGPMQDIRVRRAWAMAIDIETLAKLRAPGATLANGPFTKGTNGYLDDTGYPKYDPEKAKALLDDYKKEKGITGPLKITHQDTAVPDNQQTIAVMKQMLDKVGFDVQILPGLDLAAYTGVVLTGQFDVSRTLGLPYLDPDLMRTSLSSDGCGGPVNCPKSIGTPALNINRISSGIIDAAFDQIRGNSDPVIRKRAAETINHEIGENAFLFYRWRGRLSLAACTTCSGLEDFKGPNGEKLVTATTLAYLGTPWLSVG